MSKRKSMEDLPYNNQFRCAMTYDTHCLLFKSSYDGKDIIELYLMEIDEVYRFFTNLYIDKKIPIRHMLNDTDAISFENYKTYCERFNSFHLAEFQLKLFEEIGIPYARDVEKIARFL